MSKKVNLALAITTALGIAAVPVVQASPFSMKDLAQGYNVKAAEAAKEAKPATDAKPAADAKPAQKDHKDAKKGEAGKCGGAGKCGADKKPK